MSKGTPIPLPNGWLQQVLTKYLLTARQGSPGLRDAHKLRYVGVHVGGHDLAVILDHFEKDLLWFLERPADSEELAFIGRQLKQGERRTRLFWGSAPRLLKETEGGPHMLLTCRLTAYLP